MLFQAASETLLTLARDRKRLGATSAIAMVRDRHYGLASASHVRPGTLERARALLLKHHAGTAQPTKQDHGDAPQTWVECLLALTGIDAARAARPAG